MYINSKCLLERIENIASDVLIRSNGKIVFEEYITLPFYGQIILRFALNDNTYNVDDLDHYEALLYECVNDEFLVDFMGEVYRNVGIDYREMDNLFSKCLSVYNDEITYKANYSNLIDSDAKYLLGLCGLDIDLPVWEIQLEEEVYLLLFGDRNEKMGTYSKDGLTINVFTANATACNGLTKAVFYSKRNDISLARALLQVQERN